MFTARVQYILISVMRDLDSKKVFHLSQVLDLEVSAEGLFHFSELGI